MSVPTPLRQRRYVRSGFYSRQEPPPEVARAMAEYRAEPIADQGGEEQVSAARRSLIELAVAARFT